MIIGVLSQKGGVGKTTLSLNIASHYAGQGRKVLLVDADPQGSALAWSSARDLPPPLPGRRDGEAVAPPGTSPRSRRTTT